MNEHDKSMSNDEDISTLYAKASDEQTPPQLDDAILAAAAAQTQSKNNAKAMGPFSRRWSVPVSLAAVIVMSVSLVTLIQHESPEELTSIAEPVLSQSASHKPQPIKSTAKESRHARKRDKTAKDTRVEPSTPKKRKVNTPQDALALERAADNGNVSRELDKQADELHDRQASFPEVFGIASSRAIDSKNKSAASAFVAAVLTASCESLKIADCLESLQCTLTAKDKGYVCRQARNHCEQGFSQKTGTAKQCNAKPDCKFVPGQCFCPPNVVCVCGGGPPRRCEVKGKR